MHCAVHYCLCAFSRKDQINLEGSFVADTALEDVKESIQEDNLGHVTVDIAQQQMFVISDNPAYDTT